MARREIGARPTGGGDDRILDFKDKDHIKIRLLEPYVEEWRQYTLRERMDDDSDTVRFVVASSGDPLARKGFRSSQRSAVNVWDYETGSIKILMGGPQIFREFDDMRETGIDPTASDIIIRKVGKGRDTKYTVQRMDSAPFEHSEKVDQDGLHDTSKFDNPPTVEELFKILGELQIDYDSIPLPTFTLDEALAFVCPYKKHKGSTLADVYAEDADYMEYITSSAEARGEVGGDVYIAMKTVLTNGEFDPYEGVPRQADFVEAGSSRANPTTTAPPASTSPKPAPAAPPPAAASDDDDEPEDAPAPAAAAQALSYTDDDLKGAASFAKWLSTNKLGSFTPEKDENGKWSGNYEGDDEDVAFGGYDSRKELLRAVADHLTGDGPEDDAPANEPDEPEESGPAASDGDVSDDDLRTTIGEALRKPPYTDWQKVAEVLERLAGGKFDLQSLSREELEAVAAEVIK